MRSELYRFRKQAFSFVLTLLVLIRFEAYAQSEPLKIMPLGNSITQGGEKHPSYRYELWKMLVDAGVNFEFVGSQNLNWNNDTKAEVPSPNVNETRDGKTFTNIHEGHWGWRIDEILNGRDGPALRDWVRTHKPDIVLLHLGTNDLFQNQTTGSTLDELRQVVAVIRDERPAATIFMAQLIPADEEDPYLKYLSEQIPIFNSEIPALVAELNNNNNYPNSRVVLVDQNTGFNPTKNWNSDAGEGDTYDGLHPNFLGEAKMAQRWFDAIMDEIIIPLPVELVSFKGKPTLNGVSLYWQTASELDNHYFEVQRGQTASDFKAVDRVEGIGTTSLPQQYTFEDKDAKIGVNYYRLRQVDFDGTESYSPVIAVSLAQADTEDMRVYPTRVQGKTPVTLQLLALQPMEKFNIGIYTLDGKLVKEFDAEADARGNFIQLLNPSELSDATMYMVRATLPGRAFIRHLLVDR